MEGRVMVVQRIGGGKVQVYLCREDVRVEVAGKASRLHTLYDWGATVTLVTHAAAEKVRLKRVRQPTHQFSKNYVNVASKSNRLKN
jgi:hypothetical protein